MKNFKFIHRFGSVALMAMALLSSASSLSSCSGEGAPDSPEITSEQPTVTIKIFTPVLTRTTRADGDTDGLTRAVNTSVSIDEAKISSLYLFIYRVKDSSEITGSDDESSELVEYADCTAKSSNLNSQYGIYNAPLKPTKYRFYVVANLDSYLSDDIDLSSISESSLKTLSLNFAAPLSLAITSAEGKVSGGLPMGVSAAEMTTTSSVSGLRATDGTFDLSKLPGGEITIQGDMTILCAKLRYTFLFDNREITTSKADNTLESSGGFSYPYKTFEVKGNSIDCLLEKTPLFSEMAETSPATFESALIPGNHYTYPTLLMGDDDKVLFPTITDFTDSPVDLTETNTEKSEMRAYQGTVYLPENCYTSDNLKSVMHLAILLDGSQNNYDIVLPYNQTGNCDDELKHTDDTTGEKILKRGHFYDIIGKITASGMQFYVKVNPWENTGRTTFDF